MNADAEESEPALADDGSEAVATDADAATPAAGKPEATPAA